jgi:hypothetical protein
MESGREQAIRMFDLAGQIAAAGLLIFAAVLVVSFVVVIFTTAPLIFIPLGVCGGIYCYLRSSGEVWGHVTPRWMQEIEY